MSRGQNVAVVNGHRVGKFSEHFVWVEMSRGRSLVDELPRHCQISICSKALLDAG
jgi:hypothetical protein